MELPTFDTIKVALNEKGNVATVTFDRPEVRNALNQEMVNDVRAALNVLNDVADLQVIIFTGAGEKAFVAGADIGELRERKREGALAAINSSLFREIEAFPVPTIAAINGHALGGGCELVMACDLRVAAEHAKLGQPEVGLGIIPGAGGTYRLPRYVGLGKARELIFTGALVDAAEAKEIGLVNDCVPASELMEKAMGLAEQIAKNGNLAVRQAKLCINQTRNLNAEDAVAFESAAQAECFDSQEKYDRMTKFLERKKK